MENEDYKLHKTLEMPFDCDCELPSLSTFSNGKILKMCPGHNRQIPKIRIINIENGTITEVDTGLETLGGCVEFPYQGLPYNKRIIALQTTSDKKSKH